ncbi:MAG: cob(I)yrinic acid a,c-diamide adenosyltransferase, partial [Bacteroidota bacterium]
MKIYTKTGDRGETALFGGERVPKDALRIEAYGTVDELNSLLGIVRSLHPEKKLDAILLKLQNELFAVGADLATPVAHRSTVIPRIRRSDAASLEKIIDRFEKPLQPLKAFILPGGSPVASYLHFARTVCRRAERHVVRLSRNEDIGVAVIVYLNRLSDLLFVLARYANYRERHEEPKWVSGKRKI